jgi:hypothetical protein
MALWESQKPAEFVPHQVDDRHYDQSLAELAEILYRGLYQLHSSQNRSSTSKEINNRGELSQCTEDNN